MRAVPIIRKKSRKSSIVILVPAHTVNGYTTTHTHYLHQKQYSPLKPVNHAYGAATEAYPVASKTTESNNFAE